MTLFPAGVTQTSSALVGTANFDQFALSCQPLPESPTQVFVHPAVARAACEVRASAGRAITAQSTAASAAAIHTDRRGAVAGRERQIERRFIGPAPFGRNGGRVSFTRARF